MNPRNPPRIATWMMEHLTPANYDEAVAGDLIEEFRCSRSARWYWLQVITAIAVAWSRSLWQRRAPLLFAAIWSLLSPAWLLAVSRFYAHNSFMGNIWRLPFPLSIVCDFALRAAVDMFFIWVGVLGYAVLCQIAFGKLHLRQRSMALVASIVAFAIASLGVVAIVSAMFAMGYLHGRNFDGGTLTLAGVVEDFRIWTVLVRLQYFAGAAVALWFLSPKSEAGVKLAA
jgi:hypothetical protein